MCCFFKNEENKIQAWIIIDCFLNICYGMLWYMILIGFQGGFVGPIWSFIVIIANIVLLFALKKTNTKLMLFWIFTTGINIILLLITALLFVYLSIIGLIMASPAVEVILNKMARNMLRIKNIQSIIFL